MTLLKQLLAIKTMALQPRDETSNVSKKRTLSSINNEDDDNDVDLIETENEMNPSKRHTQTQRIKS